MFQQQWLLKTPHLLHLRLFSNTSGSNDLHPTHNSRRRSKFFWAQKHPITLVLQTSKISTSIYFSKWYNSTTLGKTILLALTNAHLPIRFDAGGLFAMNVQCLKNVRNFFCLAQFKTTKICRYWAQDSPSTRWWKTGNGKLLGLNKRCTF